MADSVQLYVDDSSPSISYYPFADTLGLPNLQAGWNPYFSVSGFATALGETGNGTSFHVTALNGASLSLRFNGTGIQLIGNSTNATCTLTLDGSLVQPNSSSQADNILASFQNLTNSPHTLLLTTVTSSASSLIAFDKALVTAPPPNQNSSIASTFPIQALPDNDIAFLGKWSFENNTINGNTSFHQSTTAGDRAHASFTGTSLLLTGLISPNSGRYSVTVDNDTTTTKTFSARSSFSQPDALLFLASGLDPQSTHDIDVQNVDGNVLALKVGGFEVVTQSPGVSTPSPCPDPPAPPSPHESPRGTIAALALGGILFIVLFAGALFFFMNRRPYKIRRQRERSELKTKFTRDAVLDIREGAELWRTGYDDDALGVVELSRSHGEKLETHDLSKVSPIVPSFKVPAKSKTLRAWVGQGISRSNKGKGKTKSKSSSASSYTIDLQLTPPRGSSQAARSRPASQSMDPFSSLPDLQPVTTKTAETASTAPIENKLPNVTLHATPSLPSQSDSPATSRRSSLSPRHTRPQLEHGQKGNNGPLLQYGLPNPGTSNSEKSSIEYLDVVPEPADPAGGEYAGEYDDAGVKGPSPRTSVAVDLRPEVGNTRPLLDDVVEGTTEGPQDQDRIQEVVVQPVPEAGQSTADDFLNIISTSPFRVDFVDDSHRVSSKSGSSHVRFQEALEEFGQRARGSIPQITAEPTLRSSAKYSFLDFSAASSSSSLNHSSLSSLHHNPNVSRWSSTTAPSTRASLPSVGSQDAHAATTISSTPSFPFPVSMQPQQDQSSDPSGQRRSAQNHAQPTSLPVLQLPVGQHPRSELDHAPSPTDSVPMSVSDIFFRQSLSSDGSRRASTGSHLLPAHPPLPGLSTVGEAESQDTMSQTQSGNSSPDPHMNILANSPFIVQRVLGVSTPVLSPISHSHTRSMNNYPVIALTGVRHPGSSENDTSPNPGYAPGLGRPLDRR